jgi:hypothetical protein
VRHQFDKLATAGNATVLTQMLLNKRHHLALMSSLYPWLDAAIVNGSNPGWDTTSSPTAAAIVAGFNHALARDGGVPLEEWSSRRLGLLVDGHGHAFRSARMLLGGVPVVKVESDLQESFMHHFTPGVHYESVRYDLSDVAERTRQLIEEGKRDSSRLEAMAAAAMERAVQVLHFLAQVWDGG